MKFSLLCSTWLLAWVSFVGATGLASESADAAKPFFEKKDVLLRGTDGHHTYRIPCLVATPNGALLLFCDGRVNGAGDLGKINLVLKRSLDGGKTWQALQVLATDSGPKTKIGNASAVVDARSGAVHAIYCKDLTQAFCLTSKDNGTTFQPPREVTATFKQFVPNWKFFATGHVHGIQLGAGRLVVPIFLSEVPRTGGGKRDKFHAGVIYSDDGGKTWQPGGLVPEGNLLNEHSIYQREDGSLIVNARASGVGRRMIARSEDAGQSWSKPSVEQALYDSTCQACTLVVHDRQGKRLVLFANPAGPGRKNLTVRLSRDDGETWPLSALIDSGPSAYSDLASCPDGTICVAYENGASGPYEKITVARFNLEWLLQTANSNGLKDAYQKQSGSAGMVSGLPVTTSQ